MWCSQGKRPVCAEACTGVLSARMDDGGRRARPPALSGAASVCGAKMGRQLSLEVPGCDLQPPGARTYCFKAR
jgi:hypothetical protein